MLVDEGVKGGCLSRKTMISFAIHNESKCNDGVKGNEHALSSVFLLMKGEEDERDKVKRAKSAAPRGTSLFLVRMGSLGYTTCCSAHHAEVGPTTSLTWTKRHV